MTETHVCWNSWIDNRYLCANCANRFGLQWTDLEGSDYGLSRKTGLWNGAYSAAPSHKKCESCGCALTGDVYYKDFDPNPTPEANSHIYEPEELTIPPIDFSQMTDEEIARWLESKECTELVLPGTVNFLLMESLAMTIALVSECPFNDLFRCRFALIEGFFAMAMAQARESDPQLIDLLVNYTERHENLIKTILEQMNEESED